MPVLHKLLNNVVGLRCAVRPVPRAAVAAGEGRPARDQSPPVPVWGAVWELVQRGLPNGAEAADALNALRPAQPGTVEAYTAGPPGSRVRMARDAPRLGCPDSGQLDTPPSA